MYDGIFKTAQNNPPHLFVADVLYMLTASIYQKDNLIRSAKRKAEWQDAFQEAAKIYKWKIVAWVVLDNHYHAIVESLENANTLSMFTGSYHKFTARKWNNEDGLRGRKVWWNYWDTCIRSERDYYNRMKYVYWNPVKHGLAYNPEDYLFSNYKDYLSQSESIDFMEMEEVKDVPEF